MTHRITTLDDFAVRLAGVRPTPPTATTDPATGPIGYAGRVGPLCRG